MTCQQEALARLDAIERALAPHYDVLVDKTFISNGTEWRRRVHEALAECDAAVVLLSDWALESSWVLYEATVLRERTWQDKGFKLLPIVFPDVKKEALAERPWSPLDLKEIQYPTTSDSAEIVAIIMNSIGQTRLSTRLDQMVADLTALLKNVDSQGLECAARRHGANVRGSLRAERREAVAEILARMVLREDITVVKTAISILQEMSPHLDQRDGEKILKFIRPLWVSLPAASGLVMASARRLSKVTGVAVNGWKLPETIKDGYLRRAFPKRRPLLASVDEAPSPPRTEYVRRAVRAWAIEELPGFDEYLGREAEELSDVDEYVKSRDDLFVLLGFMPSDDELSALHAEFENATFICAAPGEYQEDLALPSGVVWLLPPLREGEETKAHYAGKDIEVFLADLT